MSVSAPPRPPRPDDPARQDEFDALVEALIKEARQRAQRRRRRYAAVAALIALLGANLFALTNRGGQTPHASLPLSPRPSLAAGTADAKIAFIAAKPYRRYAGGVAYANELIVLDADQGGRRLLAGDAELLGLAWSPDGRKLAFVSLRAGLPNVFVMNADGSERRNLSHGHDYENDYAPAWSPDGQRIAFVRSPSLRPGSDSQVYVVNADGSRKRRLASKAAPAAGLAWSPDGRKLLVGTLPGPRKLLVGALPGPPTVELYLVNADGSGQRKLTAIERLDGGPVWSPDGRKIAFSMHSAIYVINPDGSGQRRLTNHGTQPAWSPDGRTIAFTRRRGSYSEISDGQTIAFDRRRGKSSEIYLMNADGTGGRRLTTRGAQPLWSPDGGKIAFQSLRDGNPEIYVMNADGTGQRRLTHDLFNDVGVAWSPGQKHQYATRR
jgi:Tol biopolymer transport system component